MTEGRHKVSGFLAAVFGSSVASVLLLSSISGCSAHGRSASHSPITSSPQVSTAQPPACVDLISDRRELVGGESAFLGHGGRFALANATGPRMKVIRDHRGIVLPVKLLWLVRAPARTSVTLAAKSAAG